MEKSIFLNRSPLVIGLEVLLRLDYFSAGEDAARLRSVDQRTSSLQERIWEHASAIANAAPTPVPVSAPIAARRSQRITSAWMARPLSGWVGRLSCRMRERKASIWAVEAVACAFSTSQLTPSLQGGVVRDPA